MKKWFNLMFGILVFFFIFVSCSEGEDRVITNPGNPPVLSVIGYLDFVLTQDNAQDTVNTFFWTPADYGKYISSTYTVQFDLTTNDFSNPVSDVVGNDIYQKAYTSENLNTILIKLGVTVGDSVAVKVRVKGEPTVHGSSYQRLDPLISRMITMTLTLVPPTTYPENIIEHLPE